jgi:hypothetical protein
MCGRIVQRRGALKYAERFGLDIRDSRIHVGAPAEL